MSTQLSPRQQFQLLDKVNVLVPFELAISSYPIRTAITHAVAELSMSGASSEEMRGVQRFVKTLTSMASADETPTMPVKALTSDLGGQQMPAQSPPPSTPTDKKKK